MVHETPPQAFVNLVAKNNRRYGGYIIHVGVMMAFVGIVASSFFKAEVKKSVKHGESFAVGPYELEYRGVVADRNAAYGASLSARVEVLRDGRDVIRDGAGENLL